MGQTCDDMPQKPPRNTASGGITDSSHCRRGGRALAQRITRRANWCARAKGTLLGLGGDSCWATPRVPLPEALRPHLRSGGEPDGLVLFARSAFWAGRLKLAPAELAVVAGGGPHGATDTVRVRDHEWVVSREACQNYSSSSSSSSSRLALTSLEGAPRAEQK